MTCGSGQRTRERFCNNPAPSGGGNDCSGSNSDQQTCTLSACPSEIHVCTSARVVYCCKSSLQSIEFMQFVVKRMLIMKVATVLFCTVLESEHSKF